MNINKKDIIKKYTTSNSYLQNSIFAEFRNETKRVRHTKFRTAHRGTEFLIMVISDNVVNQFHVTGLFLYPMETGFLMFSGGIERDQWREIG